MEYRSGFHDFIKIRGGNEMADRNYIFRVLAHASFDKMKSAINAVHEKTGRNKFFDLSGYGTVYVAIRRGIL